jgi:hypothetical protein
MTQMTVSAPEAPQARPSHRNRAASLADRLIPLSVASSRLGYSVDTLRRWHGEGHMPAVVGPGGLWSTYESFIAAVLASARPKVAGSIEEIARDWFAAHAPEAVPA